MSLLNIMMELKKVANHPYLFAAAAEDAPVAPNGLFEVKAMILQKGLDLATIGTSIISVQFDTDSVLRALKLGLNLIQLD